MKVIIVGAGEVGYNIAKFLITEGVEVGIIDRDEDKIRRISEELDLTAVQGEGSDPKVFKEAGAENADLMIAVTNSDETNMIACLIGKALFNIKRRIARIRNPDYFFNKELLGPKYLDINPAINPELEVAKTISNLLEIPFANEVIEFEEGRIIVAGFKIPPNSPVAEKDLRTLRELLKRDFVVGIILREDRVIIPKGDDVIKTNDILYMPLKREEIEDIAKMFGISGNPVKKVMIVGGGRIGYYLASAIESKIDVKIIERDETKCKKLSSSLKRSLVLHGDGTDKSLLLEENIKDMDVYITVSGSDELNLMAGLLAKKLGVKRVIAMVNNSDYISLGYELGLESVLSPRILAASIILRYIRRGDILSLTTVAENKAEIMEVLISLKSSIVKKTLREIKFPKQAVVGCIIRGERIVIPKGSDTIEEGDKLIIFVKKEAIREMEKLLI